MVKKYIVDLSEDEVSQLQTLIKKGKHKARTITRANILLMASERETDQGYLRGVFWRGFTYRKFFSNSDYIINIKKIR